MWFKLPAHVGGISVQQQEFNAEFTDAEGNSFFRAHNHFAAHILGMNLGISPAGSPEGAPEDLPVADPIRDNAIAGLSHDVQNLQSDLAAAIAKITALVNERDGLQGKLAEAEAKIEDLEEKLEAALQPPPPPKK